MHPDPAGDRHPDGRAAGSAILFLLAAGEVTSWHRVDAAEVGVHQSGGSLVLETWAEGGDGVVRTTLGPPTGDAEPQHVVAPGIWQRALALPAARAGAPEQLGSDWVLVTCVVVPEFRFDRFELAPPGWSPPVDDA